MLFTGCGKTKQFSGFLRGNGNITLGGHGSEGDVTLNNTDGNCTVHIDGGGGNITLGGYGAQGDVTLKNAAGSGIVHIDGGEGTITLSGKQVVTMDVVEELLKKIAASEAHLG